MSADSADANLPPIKSLTSSQRRVLGTMIEKALTVPESYPLTLKALTTGCNQKSARHPLTNYSEDDVEDTLTKLRELGLAAVVHTESGRTERFRHYARRRWSQLSEPQVAILGELLLRGRQPMGELRSRASRMAPAGSLDSIDQLRTELSGLLSQGMVQSDGPLERRGIEVDHDLYPHSENHEPLAEYRADEADEPVTRAAAPVSRLASTALRTSDEGSSGGTERIANLEATISELREEVASVRSEFRELADRFEDLRRQLGG